MKHTTKLSHLQNLLFAFDIDYSDDVQREEIIASKNVNDSADLSRLFDQILKPSFMSRPKNSRENLIDTLEFFLAKDETFDSVLDSLSTYFDDEITDNRKFMRTLLECLIRYENTEESQ